MHSDWLTNSNLVSGTLSAPKCAPDDLVFDVLMIDFGPIYVIKIDLLIEEDFWVIARHLFDLVTYLVA